MLQTSVGTEVTAAGNSRGAARRSTIFAARRPPTAEELALARASITQGYPRGFETAQQVARGVAQLALHGLPDTLLRRVRAAHRSGDAGRCGRVASAVSRSRADGRPWRSAITIASRRRSTSLNLGEPLVLSRIMKAVRFHEHGGPDVLRYEDAPDPQPGAGEVLVRVRACALNHLDIWNRRGVVRLPLPHISGADVAGEVARIDRHAIAAGRAGDAAAGAVVRSLRSVSRGARQRMRRATTCSDRRATAGTPSWSACRRGTSSRFPTRSASSKRRRFR